MKKRNNIKIDEHTKIAIAEDGNKQNDHIPSISKTINNFESKANETLITTFKPLIDATKNLSETYVKYAISKQELYTSMIEPLTQYSKKIIELYNPIIKCLSDSITKIFEKIDFSKIDFIYKEIAIKYLSNGFYPYKNTNIKYEELLDTNNKIKQIRIIKNGIKLDIRSHKKSLLVFYPEHRKIINEIYKLYKNRNYRLCILSLINLISIINNAQFEHLDFTQRTQVRNKLLEKQIMKDKESNYLLFSQYIKDNSLINANQLLISYKDEPSKYTTITYNRNAILHGYSKKFGTEVNCLRWFSVLFNTLEISEKFNKIENQINSY